MFVGMFELALGLWLLLPGEVFGPTLKIGPQDAVFGSLEEWQFGAVMVVLGILQIHLARRSNWEALKKLSLPTASFWVFVTAGYVMNLPQSTNVVTFSAFTLLVCYEFLELCYWTGTPHLRNKQKDSII